MNEPLAQHYLDDALQTLRDYKKLAERAFAQISDEDFFKTIDEETNSIAVNMKHLEQKLSESSDSPRESRLDEVMDFAKSKKK
jgi:hypothetical protein